MHNAAVCWAAARRRIRTQDEGTRQSAGMRRSTSGPRHERALLACAVTVALCASACHSLDRRVAFEVSRSVFQLKGLGHIVALLCDHEDGLLWERELGERSFTLVATPALRGREVVRLLRSAATAVGVFVQTDCSDGVTVLRQCSAAGLLGGGNTHWVLAGNNGSSSRAELERLTEALDVGPDSEVLLATMAADARTVHLVDAYRATPASRGPLLTHLAGTWTQASGLTPYLTGSTAVRRRNLKGTLLRAGVLVNRYREGDLPRVLGKPKDNHPLVSPVAAFSHMLTMHLQDMLNISLRLQGGTFFGLLRRLGRNDLQLLTTVSNMEPKYWDVMDYTNLPLWTERRVMVLKNPSALWSYDAWLRPLESDVWLILMALIFSTAIVLRAVGYWEVRFDEGHVEEEDSWASAITTALSMVCAQGFTTTTSWTSSRTLLLMFEFFSLFVNLFYTSGIVTFLLTFPPPFAHTIQEMIKSPFAVGVDQAVFSRVNFTESHDPLIRELYDKKIANTEEGGGFASLQELGERACSDRVAFLGSPFPMYEMLAASWSQSDICRIQEITLMPPGLLALATAKNSPYREILNQAILLLAERGQLARERLRWSVLRPRCALSDVTELDSVTFRAVAPLMCFVIVGLVLSITILGLEMLVHKYKGRWDTIVATRTEVVFDLLKDVTKLTSNSKKEA